MSSKSPPDARKAFAKRLRTLRAYRGINTAREMADRLGIDENRYTRYERAETEPDISLIIRICETLKVSPNALFLTHATSDAPHSGLLPESFDRDGERDPLASISKHEIDVLKGILKKWQASGIL